MRTTTAIMLLTSWMELLHFMVHQKKSKLIMDHRLIRRNWLNFLKKVQYTTARSLHYILNRMLNANSHARVIGKTLKTARIEGKNWRKELDKLLFTYRNSPRPLVSLKRCYSLIAPSTQDYHK